jgi:hypothetical protein
MKTMSKNNNSRFEGYVIAFLEVSPVGEVLVVHKFSIVKPVTVDFDAPVQRV